MFKLKPLANEGFKLTNQPVTCRGSFSLAKEAKPF
jgi:hypothetical protein